MCSFNEWLFDVVICLCYNKDKTDKDTLLIINYYFSFAVMTNQKHGICTYWYGIYCSQILQQTTHFLFFFYKNVLYNILRFFIKYIWVISITFLKLEI